MILRPRGDIEIELYDHLDLRVGIAMYGWQVYFDEYSLIESGLCSTRWGRWLRIRWVYLKYRFGRGKA